MEELILYLRRVRQNNVFGSGLPALLSSEEPELFEADDVDTMQGSKGWRTEEARRPP